MPPSLEPYYTDSQVTLYAGDCLDILRELPDASVDAVCTDPPYGLANTDPAHVAETITRWVNGERDYLPGGSGFMGKAWDAFVPPVAVWDDCLRVLKPGGHVLAFAGSRTVDLMTLGLRLAGFDIRDSVAWLYGSGFPKSLDVSKAIDKAAGAEREAVGTYAHPDGKPRAWANHDLDAQGYHDWLGSARQITAPATPDAERWQGWGTALKPAFEPIVVARKPLTGTVAANVLAHGTGALNIDGCRVDGGARPLITSDRRSGNEVYGDGLQGSRNDGATSLGRWPANVVLDESQAAALDEQSGEVGSFLGAGADYAAGTRADVYGDRTEHRTFSYGDNGGASRFFKIATTEPCGPCSRGQHQACDGWSIWACECDCTGTARFRYEPKADSSERVRVNGTAHPTVKPLALMRWLVRLVTPPGGTVLEPFAGSGTTVEACLLEGFQCIAIEREADYLPLIRQRINRRRDPVEAVKAAGEDGGLFDLLDGEAS